MLFLPSQFGELDVQVPYREARCPSHIRRKQRRRLREHCSRLTRLNNVLTRLQTSYRCSIPILFFEFKARKIPETFRHPEIIEKRRRSSRYDEKFGEPTIYRRNRVWWMSSVRKTKGLDQMEITVPHRAYIASRTECSIFQSPLLALHVLSIQRPRQDRRITNYTRRT